ITAPVSPLGQQFYVRSKYATSVCSPSTLALDPTREHRPENQEQAVHLLYAYLYLTDAQEGLIVIGNPLDDKKNKPGVATLLDGDPDNNFLQRALTFNPNGLLKGAKHMALHGHQAYISCDAGVVVLDLDNPLQPKVVTTLANFSQPRKVAFQFRYAFVLDNNGLHVLDVTDINNPQPVSGGNLQIADPPTYMGFSPRPEPRIVAHHKTRGPALAISEGIDRDRAVDEAGHQLSVFGRKGARPFNKQEQERLYLKNNQLYTVSNTPQGEPQKPAA